MYPSLARPDYRGYGRTNTRSQGPRRKLTGPASDRQLDWLGSLLDMRVVDPALARKLRLSLAKDTAGEYTRKVLLPGGPDDEQAQCASVLIDLVKAQPQAPAAKPAPAQPLPDVPEAHYAVLFGGQVRTVKVQRPVKGKWAGATFVRDVVDGHSSWNVPAREKRPILEAIVAAGRLECCELYAVTTGRCPVCNYALDEESQGFGIGPDCGGRGRPQTKRGEKFFAAMAPFLDEEG